MGEYQKIGTITGAVIALVVMITIRSRHGYVWGLKLLGLGLVYVGYYIGAFIDKKLKNED